MSSRRTMRRPASSLRGTLAFLRWRTFGLPSRWQFHSGNGIYRRTHDLSIRTFALVVGANLTCRMIPSLTSPRGYRKMKRSRNLAGIVICAVAVAGTVPYAGATGKNGSEPSPASFSYVSKAVLPLARTFIKTFRGSRSSEKRLTRHEFGLWADEYSNLTKLDLDTTLWAKGPRDWANYRDWANFSATTYFKGSVKPKNLVEIHVEIEATPRSRDFALSAGITRNPKPGSLYFTPTLWTIYTRTAGSGDGRNARYDSCSIEGSRGYWPTLSRPIINVSIREAQKILPRAMNHRPLKRQRNVLAGMKAARGCQSL